MTIAASGMMPVKSGMISNNLAGFAYVSSWQGMVYTAFIIDVYARRIVGWRVSTSMTTGVVLDALNQAICQRVPSKANKLVHSAINYQTPNGKENKYFKNLNVTDKVA